jgi:hypothetical protein
VLGGHKKRGALACSPLGIVTEGPLLERELHAKANDGVFVCFVAEVVSAVSEEAQVAGRNADVKTTADKEVTGVLAVGAEATTDKRVRSHADAGDWVAQHESGVEVVVFFLSGVEAIRTLDSDVLAECVFAEKTAAESVFSVVKNSATKNAESEPRCESIAANWGWRRQHWSLWIFVGDRAGDDGATDGNGCEEGHE